MLAEGPDAITLQSVATDLGMSHTNLIHHFGSAAGLQSELMRQMMSELTAAIESAVMRLRAGKGELRDFVDIVFDAFDRGGAGRLAAWIVLSGEATRLAPVGEVVRDYIDSVERGADPGAAGRARASHVRDAVRDDGGAGRRDHRQSAAPHGRARARRRAQDHRRAAALVVLGARAHPTADSTH